MPAAELSASLSAALAPVTVNGAVGQGTFQRTVFEWLKGLVLAQVDTEAERDAIVAVVMNAADQLVATKFPPALWAIVRPTIDAYLDSVIDNLPALLA